MFTRLIVIGALALGGTCLQASQSGSGSQRIVFTRKTGVAATSGLFSVRTDGTDVIRLAARGEQADWSPDGQWIAFVNHPTSRPSSLYLLNPNDRQTSMVRTSAGYIQGPIWSPDGRYLLWKETMELAPQSSRYSLWAHGPFGIPSTKPECRQVFDGCAGWGSLGTVSWSPDLDSAPEYQGRILIGIAEPAEGKAVGTYAVSASVGESGQLKIDGSVPVKAFESPHVLMSGALPEMCVAYRAAEASGAGTIYASKVRLVDHRLVLGENPRRITTEGYDVRSFHWSKDGMRLAFDANPPGKKPGVFNVFVVTPRDTLTQTTVVPSAVTTEESADSYPSFSPQVLDFVYR